MATQFSYANGNLTGATTWKTAETGSGALALVRNTTGTVGQNASVSGLAFTITNGSVIEGVLLWLYANQVTPAGTLKVALQKSGVDQASVTVNCADLPHNSTGTNDVLAVVPLFFKFTSTATGDGTANWKITLTTSNVAGAQITYMATPSTFTFALRTSTIVNVAAADDLYVVGELTGAGTHNSFTVTMDSTAATVYGNGSVNSTSVNGGCLRISCYGTVTWGTTAATNYVLRMKGDVEVMWQGTYNQGAVGAECPRNSSMDLGLQMNAANGDFGVIVRNLGTFNAAGLSRTVSKDVYRAKLTSDLSYGQITTGNFSTGLNAITTAAGPGPDGSFTGAGFQEDTSTGNHLTAWTDNQSRASSQSYIAQIWVARGTSTHNQFLRLAVNGAASATLTNAFWTDIDMSAGTASGPTAAGTATATSVNIQAMGSGWLITLIGKTGQANATTTAIIFGASALGTISYAGTSTGYGFFFQSFQLQLGSSWGGTTFNIDTDTGWLSSDFVAVAGTFRTRAHCSAYQLNANAGASSFASNLPVLGDPQEANLNNVSLPTAYSGTTPTQGEVILLTRNVKIHSINVSTATYLYGYFYAEPLATVTCSRTEFQDLGSNLANKYGIVTVDGTVANSKNFSYCSMHGMYYFFVETPGTNLATGLTVQYCTMFYSNGGIQNYNSVGATDWTYDNNTLMLCQTGFDMRLFSGTLTNNTVVGHSSTGLYYAQSGGTNGFDGVFGTISGNVAHSGNIGAILGNVNSTPNGSFANFTAWRNAAQGIQINTAQNDDLTIDNVTLFGNGNRNILLTQGGYLTVNGGTICGDASTTPSMATTYGITFGAYFYNTIVSLNNVDMSGTGTGQAPHTTQDFDLASLDNIWHGMQVCCNNVKLGTALPPKTTWTKFATWSFEKYNGTAGDHRTETKFGQLKTDSVIFNTASPSMRMTPSNGAFGSLTVSGKLTSSGGVTYNGPLGGRGVLVPVANGTTVGISVYVRKSAAGDGAAYNGAQPRLIQKANPAIGQNSDVVLATYSAGTGAWNLMTATSSTATDDGAWEFVIDCDGTAGWVNVDDWNTS